MKFTFDDAFSFLLGVEGGYVNDPHDHGGATNYGVTQNTYDNYRCKLGLPEQPVKVISLEEAKAIYKSNYWDVVRGDSFYPGLSLVLFDTAVHHGPGKATRILQEVVGVAPDGVIGPQTITAVAKAGTDKVIDDYLSVRLSILLHLAKNPGQEKFKNGWINRINKLKKKVWEIRNG